MKFCFLYFQNQSAIAGVIDLGTVETFPVFQAAQRGLIDQDTAIVLLETQLILGGLLKPDFSDILSLEKSLAEGLIDTRTRQSLTELESALLLVETIKCTGDTQQNVLPIATAMESSLIREEVGLRILSLQFNTGGLRTTTGEVLSLELVEARRLLNPSALTKLRSRLQQRDLIDPNTAEKLNLHELRQRCVPDNETGLLLLPVKQQPGGTVCLQSGRKVGIFRAVQEGLIDRIVTARLLEAQLFAGGIADPRSGHRLTIDEALRHGLMDQELACAMLARQLQNGGILDPFSGERLDLEESICRGLLSSRLALVVLESLWVFMGILWPESGELLPIVEAVQQGVISAELSRKILEQRHAIGALYNPESLQILPLNQTAQVDLEPSVMGFLRDAYIPDVLSSMNQSGTPSLNRLSWGSRSSAPTPLSPAPLTSSEGNVWCGKLTHEMDPEEQAKHKLLLHLMTHSYVDAHSGKRLVLLDPELTDILKTTEIVAREPAIQAEQQFSLRTDPKESSIVMDQFNLTEKELSERQTEIKDGNSDENQFSAIYEIDPETNNTILENTEVITSGDKTYDNANGKPEKRENFSLMTSADNIVGEFPKNPDELQETKSKSSVVQEKRDVETVVLKSPDELFVTESKFSESSAQETAPVNSEGENRSVEGSFLLRTATNDFNTTQPDGGMDTKDFLSESENSQQKLTTTNSAETPSQIKSGGGKEEEDAEFARLVSELKRGGLLTEDGEKLLPDEAVAQGVIPGHVAVRLMAEASLFGGFLNANSVETLSMEDVLQEDLTDEDLMWSVLKSDKSLSGVVDAEKRKILSVREAAQEGLIDLNTATRLLEGQVASGGIVDLRSDKKVSVTSAANLGLIEEAQTEELMALEQACKGKLADSAVAFTKATLQLQMEGLVDPESKSPVSLEQAIQKGLINPKRASQVLAQQIAEGGIIHHASGIRLSVRDAVNRGLVDRSISSGLEELEWACQGKVSLSSHPEALILQASTGTILDPDSGCKLTLTEAVSKGLLEEDIAHGATVSKAVTKAVLDPQTARIVPFSELVNQGKVDVETGKRFLEVKPFKGIRNDKTKENMTLPEAVASTKVDPIPAIRLLQSQADTGGIVDINTGERLPLFEACKRGLVEDKMMKAIAINQFSKEGLINPNTQHQTPSLQEATGTGVISAEIPSKIQENVGTDEGSFAVDTSQSEAYNTSVIPSLSSPDSSNQVPSTLQKTELVETRINGKTETLMVSNPPHHYGGKVKEVSDVEVSVQQDQLIDLSSIEKEIQQPIEKAEPEADINKADSPTQQKLDEGLRKRDSDSVEENVIDVFLLDEKTEKAKEETKEDREGTGSFSRSSDIDHKRSEVSAEPEDVDEERGEEKPPVFDVQRSEPLLLFPPRLTQSKTKKRKKSKKNGKGKADEEMHPQDIKPLRQIDQAYSEVKSQDHSAVHKELESQNKHGKTQTYGQTLSSIPLDSDVKKEQDIAKGVFKQDQEKNLVVEKSEKISTKLEEDAVKIVNDKENDGNMMEAMKRKEQEEKVELTASVSEPTEQPGISHEIEKVKQQELPQRAGLPDNEKAALVLKAKERILKKVFEKGVSDKQAAKELEALRNDTSKKETKCTVDQDAGLPVNGMENNSVKDDKKPKGLPKESEKDASAKGNKETTVVKEDSTSLKLLVKETTEIKTLQRLGNETKTTALSNQAKETQPGKQKKKNKKKSQNMKDIAEDKKEKFLTKNEITTNSEKVTAELDKPTSVLERNTDTESARDVTGSPLCDETEAFKEPEGKPPYFNLAEEPVSHIEEALPLAEVLSPTSQESHKSEIQPTDQSMTPDTQPDKGTGENEKKKHKSPATDVADLSKSKPFEDRQQYTEMQDLAKVVPSVSKSAVPEWDAASKSVEEEGVVRELVSNQEEMTYKAGKVGSDE